MTVKTYQLKQFMDDGTSIVSLDYYNDSTVTRYPVVPPRTKGRVNMSVANPHTFQKCALMNAKQWPALNGTSPTWTAVPQAVNNYVYQWPPNFSFASLDSVVASKFNGKLRKGSASMGVTLGSWSQSREMIVKRSSDLGKVTQSAYNRLNRNPKQLKELRHKREPLANEVLETEFGWRPLYEDFHTALTSVCQDGIPDQWITSRHREYLTYDTGIVTNGYTKYYRKYLGRAMVTYSANVAIANPNLWLLNRLGLVNPATVIWDLIPWSFVVNMFVNVNAMISSVTDEVGLDIKNRSITRSALILREEWFNNSYPFTRPNTGYQAEYKFNYRSRVLDAKPSVKWTMKAPKVNWELALIASSLALQKVTRLNNLIKGL
jgi:hypothetical protein